MTQIIREENSSTNTVLIVIVLGLIVAFGFWFFNQNNVAAPAEENPGINVDVNLPAGGEQNPATTPAPQEGGTQTPQ